MLYFKIIFTDAEDDDFMVVSLEIHQKYEHLRDKLINDHIKYILELDKCNDIKNIEIRDY